MSVHLPSTAFVQRKRPAHIKEFREKQGSGVASTCLRVSTQQVQGRRREDEASKVP